MTQTVNMPKGFRAAFEFVCSHYRCTEEEVELMKAAVREHPEDAATCYLAMQKRILGDAQGINERIRASIQEGGNKGDSVHRHEAEALGGVAGA